MRLDPSTVSAHPSGDAARQRTRERAFALAAGDGRAASDVLKADWEQAKYEVSGPAGACRLRMGCASPTYQLA